jgi:hypothetical protein
LMVDVRLCEFEAMIMDKRRFRFRAADCEAITDELSLVDWHCLFSRKRVDLCIDLFYDIIWSCFEKFVPKTSTRCAKNLNTLCPEWIEKQDDMVDDQISECDCA